MPNTDTGQTLTAPKFSLWSFAPAILLASVLVLFALNSFPMMRPGFDMWWHMGMTEAPQSAHPRAFPASRILWHHFWHLVLNAVGLHDVFDRALLVHRTQFVATLVLLTTSAYLSLRAITHRLRLEREQIWVAAIFASVIWLLMHGTESTARGGGPGSHVVQSWIMWYSLNYQISLPFYFAATGFLLYALSAATNGRQRVLAFAMSAVLITVASLSHAAETAYFLICLCFLALLYLRGKRALGIAAALVLLGGAVLWLALGQAYIKPELFTMLTHGDHSSLLSRLESLGGSMTRHRLNRLDTGWHVLHTIALASLVLVAILGRMSATQQGSQQGLDWRPLMLIGLTSLMPLALAFTYSAGALAMLTHLRIAWRFAFASFLFVGTPLLALLVVHQLRTSHWMMRQLLVAGLVILMTGFGLAYSAFAEKKQPAFQFGRSLILSLSPEKTHFGLTPVQRDQLSDLATKLRARHDQSLICTDLYTAYYLFFVERYRAVHLPSALRYIPGYRSSKLTCKFQTSPESMLWGQISPNPIDLPSLDSVLRPSTWSDRATIIEAFSGIRTSASPTHSS